MNSINAINSKIPNYNNVSYSKNIKRSPSFKGNVTQPMVKNKKTVLTVLSSALVTLGILTKTKVDNKAPEEEYKAAYDALCIETMGKKCDNLGVEAYRKYVAKTDDSVCSMAYNQYISEYCDSISMRAWQQYDSVTNKAWKEYDSVTNKAWKQYRNNEITREKYEAIREGERQKYNQFCKQERQKYYEICKDAKEKYNALCEDAEKKYNDIIKRAYNLERKYNILQPDITSLEKYEQNIRKEHHKLELNEINETFLSVKLFGKLSRKTSVDKKSTSLKYRLSNPYYDKNVRRGTSSPRELYGYMASVFRAPTGF